MRRPMGSWPGHRRRAAVSLMTTTLGVPSRSSAVNAAPFLDRNRERPEIVRAHVVQADLRGLAREAPARGHAPLVDLADDGDHVARRERRGPAGGRAGHAGQRLQALEERPPKDDRPGAVVVADARGIEAEGQHPRRIEARLESREAAEAPRQQAGADREGPGPGRSAPAPAGRARTDAGSRRRRSRLRRRPP